ncbi:MAG: acetyl-CoA carboxylase, biotin carboxyl carrier protein, partial [Deltaproteobacteria bacterium]|nr:acetyl-CoA carboxylase, biotin carboxyl carrier protein [Deltaproteobacteria bacterium]
MDLKDIKAIIDLMKKNSVTEFELEREDFKIRLKRGGNGGVAVPAPVDEAGIIYTQPSAMVPAGAAAAAPPVPAYQEVEIKSPMIGTFYRSPSPESAPYIEVGME